MSSLQVKSWVVALDAKSPLKTFKQGGSSEAQASRPQKGCGSAKKG